MNSKLTTLITAFVIGALGVLHASTESVTQEDVLYIWQNATERHWDGRGGYKETKNRTRNWRGLGDREDCKTCAHHTEDTLMGELSDFIHGLPAGELPVVDNWMMPEMTERGTEVMNQLVNILVDMASKDENMIRMGITPEYIQRYIGDGMSKLVFGHAGRSGVAGLHSLHFDENEDWKSKVFVAVSNRRTNHDCATMIHVLLHELAHAWGASEPVAELVVTEAGERSRLFNWHATRDWEYNKAPLQRLLHTARENGQEREFWNATFDDEKMRKFWDKGSPQIEQDGESRPMLSYDEWQTIRAVSGGARDGTVRRRNVPANVTEMKRHFMDTWSGERRGILSRAGAAVGNVISGRYTNDSFRKDIDAIMNFASENDIRPLSIVYGHITGSKNVLSFDDFENRGSMMYASIKHISEAFSGFIMEQDFLQSGQENINEQTGGKENE